MPPVETTTADGDVRICWDAVTEDLQCHSVDTIEGVYLFKLTEGSEQKVVDELLAQNLNDYLDVAPFRFYPEDGQEPCVNLSEFTVGDEHLALGDDYVEADDKSYLMIFSTSRSLGLESRSMLFLRPSSDSDVDEVNAVTGCGMLSYDPDLSSLQKVEVPREGPWVVNWKNVKHTGDGAEFPTTTVDHLLLGFYEGRDVKYIEEHIFDIEVDPDASIWEMDLEGGRSADLADVKARDGGASFSGFDMDTEGVWLLGLFCTSCASPAPVLLTVLDPTG